MNKAKITLLLLLIATTAWAQRLVGTAPGNVAAGENFRVEYNINTSDVSQIRLGKLPDGLENVYGPSTSTQSSYSVVNGHATSSSSTTFTYVFQATRNGAFTIPPAIAIVSGTSIKSNALKINVSGSARQTSGAPRFHDDNDNQPRMREAGSAISNSDLFIKVSASKTRVHEQEPVLLTYKVYTLVDLSQLEGKMPDLKGFHTQEIPLPQQKSLHYETLNGRNYKCVTWSQYVVYPQMTGKLTIPSIVYKGIVMQRNRNIDPLEAFFNGGSDYIEVKRNITAPPVDIEVLPLPTKPQNFSGGVGNFSISSQLDKKEIKAGNPVTLRVVVSGNGNLKLITQPDIQVPKDFEKYDPKVTDKTSLTANGIEGNVIYDYILVPRNKGTYTIPAVSLVYYDTTTNSYKTISTSPQQLIVSEGDPSSQSEYEDVKDKDIHGIKFGNVTLEKNDGNHFYGSTGYIASICIIILAFIALLAAFWKRAIDNADIVKTKGKKANKVATKRLRNAFRFMNLGRSNEFYDEVLHALWGYISDKLNIPTEELSRETAREKLTGKGIDEETTSAFMAAIEECEYERYAPGDEAGNMNKTYTTAMDAITKIEDMLKGKKRKGLSSHIMLALVTLILSLASTSALAITKENADTQYKKGDYQQAISDYEELLKTGRNADVFYNLGNAYYRTDNITKAILNYERALIMQPGDKDIRFNLQLARSKTIDKISSENTIFIATWYESLVHYTSIDNWATIAIVSIILSLVLFLIYLFSPSLLLRKMAFFGAILFIIVFVFANIFAYDQKKQNEKRKGAIVMSPSVSVKKTPADDGNEVFVIHEGSKVQIIDQLKDWRHIELSDSRNGWVKKSDIENI